MRKAGALLIAVLVLALAPTSSWAGPALPTWLNPGGQLVHSSITGSYRTTTTQAFLLESPQPLTATLLAKLQGQGWALEVSKERGFCLSEPSTPPSSESYQPLRLVCASTVSSASGQWYTAVWLSQAQTPTTSSPVTP